jgi:type II secretory pathway component GspD/PulD (secretin)
MNKTILALAVAAVAGTAAPAQEGDAPDARKQEILNKLNSMRVGVEFNGTPMEEALNFIREFSGLNIVVDAEVPTKLTEDQLKVTLKVKDLLLKSVLKLMLNPRDLTAVYREGVLLILPKGKADHAVTLQMYDVRDLLVKIQDFPGPKVELVPATGQRPDMGAVFILEDSHSTITEEFITEMVKTNTGDHSWEENPNASITLANGILVVSQSRRVHQEIRQFLSKLQQYR